MVSLFSMVLIRAGIWESHLFLGRVLEIHALSTTYLTQSINLQSVETLIVTVATATVKNYQ